MGEWIFLASLGLILLFWVIRTALNSSHINANMIEIGKDLSKLARQQREDMATVHRQLSEMQDQLYDIAKNKDR